MDGTTGVSPWGGPDHDTGSGEGQLTSSRACHDGPMVTPAAWTTDEPLPGPHSIPEPPRRPWVGWLLAALAMVAAVAAAVVVFTGFSVKGGGATGVVQCSNALDVAVGPFGQLPSDCASSASDRLKFVIVLAAVALVLVCVAFVRLGRRTRDNERVAVGLGHLFVLCVAGLGSLFSIALAIVGLVLMPGTPTLV